MKKCSKCAEFKSLNEFHKRGNALYSRCKECASKYLAGLRDRNRKYAWDYLLEHPCIDCGESNPAVLDFDHREMSTKYKGICELVRNHANLEKIQEEINKCDIRCSNCHRIRTAKQRNFWYVDLI